MLSFARSNITSALTQSPVLQDMRRSHKPIFLNCCNLEKIDWKKWSIQNYLPVMYWQGWRKRTRTFGPQLKKRPPSYAKLSGHRNPENGPAIYREILQKMSTNLIFISKNLEISPKNPHLSRKLFENNRIICMKCEIPVVNLYGLEAPSNWFKIIGSSPQIYLWNKC